MQFCKCLMWCYKSQSYITVLGGNHRPSHLSAPVFPRYLLVSPLTWCCCFVLSLQCSVIVLSSHRDTDRRTLVYICTICPHVSMLSVPMYPLPMCVCDLSTVYHHNIIVSRRVQFVLSWEAYLCVWSSPSRKPLGHFALQMRFLYKEEVQVAMMMSSAPKC